MRCLSVSGAMIRDSYDVVADGRIEKRDVVYIGDRIVGMGECGEGVLGSGSVVTIIAALLCKKGHAPCPHYYLAFGRQPDRRCGCSRRGQPVTARHE